MAMPVARLRMKKSAPEIALIQRTTDVTLAAHRAAWKRIQAGLNEYQVAATMTDTYFEQGCERNAYSPIVGSGRMRRSYTTRRIGGGWMPGNSY